MGEFFFEDNDKYNFQAFKKSITDQYLQTMVLTNIETDVRLTLEDNIYEIYDFDQNLYGSVEEGISKIVTMFPREDPIELLGLH